MTDPVRVLVFPCGAENALEIHQALRYSLHVHLVGASSVDDHGRFLYSTYVGGLPNIRDDTFEAAFRAVVEMHGIQVVFATHDSVLEYLAPRAVLGNYYLVNGDPRTSRITRHKRETYSLFADKPWCPSVYSGIDTVERWPIVMKPNEGQGGQEVFVVATPDTAPALATGKDLLFVEHLPGEEISVDCFTDRRGRLIWVGPRTRERVRAGIAMRSRFRDADPELVRIAEEIQGRLTMRGPWFFQLKRDATERWKLLEVCNRIGGTMVAQRARGVNLPLMAIHDFLERDVAALPMPHVTLVDRRILTRAALEHEYDTVYVDLDDTLMIGGHANPIVVAFLYQSIARGKQVKLITRHSADPRETLRHARLSPDVFNEILHISAIESKADFMTPRAIFIDNHFPERADVMRRVGIPALDVDAVEFLLDHV